MKFLHDFAPCAGKMPCRTDLQLNPNQTNSLFLLAKSNFPTFFPDNCLQFPRCAAQEPQELSGFSRVRIQEAEDKEEEEEEEKEPWLPLPYPSGVRTAALAAGLLSEEAKVCVCWF